MIHVGRKDTIDLLVDGGKASPGPTSAPKLSAYKLNVGEIFKTINEATANYSGMQVPVKIEVDSETKEWRVTVGTPPVSSMIKRELGVSLAKITEEDKTAGKTSVGDLKMEQVLKIAKAKQEALLSKDLKAVVKVVLGTCASMPMTVEGKNAKEIIKEVDAGKFEDLLK